ncbi:MAG: glycoside hydrolase family 27 protein [Clostridiales bacterium]|nr:glycoside hydrolase family 27 protein [Clostridiales bacterium]
MIAQTPPMGWNSWDCYGAAVTEENVRRNAAYMAEHLKDCGWEYIVVDIQWSSATAVNHQYQPFSALDMDAWGRLIPAVNRFPSAAGGKGFRPLADYIHSLGLKFGIHIMRGMPREAAHRHLPIEGSSYGCHEAADPNSICAWNPDMYGLKCEEPAAKAYYESIFRLYAEWGVDYVKCDDIAREYPHCRKEIEVISQARLDCGRDIVLSLSPGPAPLEQAEHLKKWSNLWRITDDFWDSWPLLRNMFERLEKWCVHAGPGHWPDADMLPLGALRQCDSPEEWTHFTRDEQRTMMTLWCIARSPLMMGGEMTKNDDWTLKLLTNRDVLAMETESWCAHPLWTTEEESVWLAPRKDGKGFYLAFFNLTGQSRTVRVSEKELEHCPATVKDLWEGAEAAFDGLVSAEIPAHGAAAYLCK